MKMYNYEAEITPKMGKKRIDSPRAWNWRASKEQTMRGYINDRNTFPNSLKFIRFLERDIPSEFMGYCGDNGLSYEGYHILIAGESIDDIFERFIGCKIKVKIEVLE